MNHQELFTELTAIGMNMKQAKLYVAALQLGTVPASRIANKAEINRATAYHLLDEMAADGYVVISDRVGTRHYTAIEPDKLLTILEEKKMEIARKQERLSGVIGLLSEIRQNKTVEPTVKFYEGRMGLKDLMRRSLRANELIRGWDLTKDFDKDFLKFLREEFVPERIRKGIKTNVIANEGSPQMNDEYMREIRVLPDKSLDVDMRVYDNTVMIISYAPEEYFGVEIESPYIAQSLKGIFDTIWNMLPAAKANNPELQPEATPAEPKPEEKIIPKEFELEPLFIGPLPPPVKKVEIDLNVNRLRTYENDAMMKEYIISPGKWSTPTPTGNFKIYNKSRDAYSRSYKLWMPNWNAITANGAYGIHGLPYWKTRSGRVYEGANHLGLGVSHGCVRLSVSDSNEFYEWADNGTPINIHR